MFVSSHLSILCLVAYFSAVMCSNKDIIMKPNVASKGNDIAMILAPGCGIGPDAYIPLMESLQKLIPGLWVGIPALPANVSTIGMKKGVERVADSLLAAGLAAGHETFYSGHSLGGVVISSLVSKPEKLPDGFNDPKGMVLMGSFLTRSFKSDAVAEIGPGQYAYPTCPVLTIGGELDGLCRISRIAESSYTMINMAEDPDRNAHYFPVTAIKGMSHMQFASGEIPLLVKDRDFVPEITYDEAHALVAADMSYFMQALLGNASYSQLDARMQTSQELFSPLIEALHMEGYHQFKPPCYCEAVDEYGGLEYGTCPEQPGCTAGTPWTARATAIMGGDVNGLEFAAMDSQHMVTEEDPSCHLPKVHAGTDRATGVKTPNSPSGNPGNGKDAALCEDASRCTLEMTSITQVWYETGSEMDIWRLSIGSDTIDSGFVPVSAKELKSKMKSRQAIWQAANVTGAADLDLDVSDGLDAARCAEINQAAIDYALNLIPDATRKRYESVGQQLVVSHADKKVCAAGPCWIWSGLDYNDHGDQGVELFSASFPYKNSNPFPCGEKGADGKHLPCPAGMHYCKLLSPARAVEWMYVDSLRLHASLKAQMPKVGASWHPFKPDTDPCCEECNASAGLAKFWSIDDIFNQCGEACMSPDDYDLYHKFEKNLLPAEGTNTPCADHGYPKYKKTMTHGAGPIKMTFDMYTR